VKGGRQSAQVPRKGAIAIKDEDEIARMRRAGRIVALTLERLGKAAVPGVTTGELDRIAEAAIRSFGAEPTFHNLYGYPAHICVSVNDEVVHGIPGERRLAPGDIVSFDVGATVADMMADGASTVGVGPISAEAERLLRVTQEALTLGLAEARAGQQVARISAAIQRHVESRGYSVVRELVGHGVGHAMHEAPQVPNFVDRDERRSPVLNAGAWEVVKNQDGWTYRTKDGSLSAHFEHTVVVRAEGCEILTARESLWTREPRAGQ